MDDNLQNLLSQLIPDEIENSLGLGGARGGKKEADQDQNQLADLLKSLAGQAGGPVENEVNHFLGGKGKLYGAASESAKSGGRSSSKELVKILTEQFNLAPALAQTIAPLLLRLLPAIGNLTGGGQEAAESKTSPKAKPARTPASGKGKESSSKKPASKPAPKPASKPAAKPRKKPAAEETPKKPRRRSTGEVE